MIKKALIIPIWPSNKVLQILPSMHDQPYGIDHSDNFDTAFSQAKPITL
jgi:hypothetical protein